MPPILELWHGQVNFASTVPRELSEPQIAVMGIQTESWRPHSGFTFCLPFNPVTLNKSITQSIHLTQRCCRAQGILIFAKSSQGFRSKGCLTKGGDGFLSPQSILSFVYIPLHKKCQVTFAKKCSCCRLALRLCFISRFCISTHSVLRFFD